MARWRVLLASSSVSRLSMRPRGRGRGSVGICCSPIADHNGCRELWVVGCGASSGGAWPGGAGCRHPPAASSMRSHHPGPRPGLSPQAHRLVLIPFSAGVVCVWFWFRPSNLPHRRRCGRWEGSFQLFPNCRPSPRQAAPSCAKPRQAAPSPAPGTVAAVAVAQWQYSRPVCEPSHRVPRSSGKGREAEGREGPVEDYHCHCHGAHTVTIIAHT